MHINISTAISLMSALITLLSIGIGIGTFKQQIVTLTKEVEKHNKVIERTFKLENNIGNHDIGAIVAKQETLISEVADIRKDIKELNRQ